MGLDHFWARPLSRSGELPRALQPRLFFVSADLIALGFGQADIVEAVDEAMLAECVELEMPFSPSGREIVWFSRSIVITALAPFLASSISSSQISFGTGSAGCRS